MKIWLRLKLVIFINAWDLRGVNTFCCLHIAKRILILRRTFLSLFNAINAIAKKYDMPILYSCHPRSRKRLEETGFSLDSRVIRHDPLGFHDYNCLQMNAAVVISDSGTLPEESSFFYINRTSISCRMYSYFYRASRIT